MPLTLDPAAPPRLAIVRLGYVGLPLSTEFGKPAVTLASDIDAGRIAELEAGLARTRAVVAAELRGASKLRFSADPAALAARAVFVVTVPTPIDAFKRPDLRPLEA